MLKSKLGKIDEIYDFKLEDKDDSIRTLENVNKKQLDLINKLKIELMKNKDDNYLINEINSLKQTNHDLLGKLEMKDKLM